MKWTIALICISVFVLLGENAMAESRDYIFDGTISLNTLENYLSKSIQILGLCSEGSGGVAPCFEDNLRMIRNIQPKYIGRAAYSWDCPKDDEEHFRLAKENALKVHRIDPDIILQACVFETAYKPVDNIPIPAWVFEEFGLKPEIRNFRYQDMLYPDGRLANFWGTDASVPDITRIETRMWFYYRACRYIDSGYESLHFGQVQLMGQTDTNWSNWKDVVERCRKYGKKHGRRHFIMFDAHFAMTNPNPGVVVDGKLLWDFISFPLRPMATDNPLEARLKIGYIDSMYARAPGGLHPAGWTCDAIPQLYEIDNCFPGLSENGGEHFIWGTDEATWFANCTEDNRNKFLHYAYDWIWKYTSRGYFQVPGRRPAAVPVTYPKVWQYLANTRSDACPDGFNQEETIKSIWNDSSYVDISSRKTQPEPQPAKRHIKGYSVAIWPCDKLESTDDTITTPDISGNGFSCRIRNKWSLEELKAIYSTYGGFSDQSEKVKGSQLLQDVTNRIRTEILDENELKCIRFNGHTYLDFGEDMNLASSVFTLSMRVKIDSFADDFMLIGRSRFGESGYYIKYYAKEKLLYAEVFDGGKERKIVAFKGVEPGKWVHLAITTDGRKLVSYVNGKESDQIRAGRVIPCNDSLRAGAECRGISVNDIRYYNKALSWQDIAVIFHENSL